MSNLPAAWQRELAKQRELRKKIDTLQRSYDWWKERTAQILREGGLGWVTRIGRANLKMDRVWRQLLRLTLNLNRRDVPQ